MRPLARLARGIWGRALLAVLPAMGGCSYLFVTPPHDSYGGSVVGCTTSKAAPAVDTLFVFTNVASAIYVAGKDNVSNKDTAVGFGLGVAALWLSSAIYGYSNTSKCEELLEEDYSPHYAPPRPVRRPTWDAPPRTGAPPPATGWSAPVESAPAAPGPSSDPDAVPAPRQPAVQQHDDDDEPGARHRPWLPRPPPVSPEPK